MSVHFEVHYEWKTRKGRRWLSATDRFATIEQARVRFNEIASDGGDEQYLERDPELFKVEKLS
jgi:hypothetical protein